MRASPTLLALAAALPLASAAERHWIGPRATAMGGVGIASIADADAGSINPAVLGFMWRGADDLPPPADGDDAAADYAPEDNQRLGGKRWGLSLSFQGGVELTEDFGDYIDVLEEIDNVELATTDGITAAQAEQMLDLVTSLVGIQDDDLGVRLDVNAGVALRIGRFSVGARYWADTTALVRDIDLVNIGLEDATELTSALNDASNAQEIIGQDPTTYTVQTLTAAQQSALAAYGVNGIKAIDKVVTDAKAEGLIDDAKLQTVIDTLGLVPLASSGSLSDNTTAVTAVGLGVAEIPVSYGYAFDDRWSIGATAKLMLGRVYGASILVFSDDEDAVEDEIRDIQDEYEETTTFGIDVAGMFRISNFQFALAARDLNTPTFDGFITDDGLRVPDIELDPSLTAGVAWIPWPRLVVEANAELIPRDTLLEVGEVQHAGVGVEWTGLRFLALRGGISGNLAESDQDPVVSAGIGLNFWLLQIDLAGGMALDTVEYDGDEYPEEARFSLGIRSEW